MYVEFRTGASLLKLVGSDVRRVKLRRAQRQFGNLGGTAEIMTFVPLGMGCDFFVIIYRGGEKE